SSSRRSCSSFTRSSGASRCHPRPPISSSIASFQSLDRGLMWRNCMLPPLVLLARSATTILPKKFPGRLAIFSLELAHFDLVIGICRRDCLRRVSRWPFVGYFEGRGPLEFAGRFFQDVRPDETHPALRRPRAAGSQAGGLRRLGDARLVPERNPGRASRHPDRRRRVRPL